MESAFTALMLFAARAHALVESSSSYVKQWCGRLLAHPPPKQPCWGASELRRRHRTYRNQSLSLEDVLRTAATDDHGRPIFPSEGGQERWLWLHHFRYLKRPPVYLDFGCNDAVHDSNTFFFDQCLGATNSICIDAQAAVGPRFEAWRRCSFTPTCLSNKPVEVVFAVGGTDPNGVSTKSGVLKDNKSYKRGNSTARPYSSVKMTCTTGAALMDSHKITHADLLDLDAEGHELAILQGIDWTKTTIDLILIEANDLGVTAYLSSLGYTKHATKLLRDDLFLRKDFTLLGKGTNEKAVCTQQGGRARLGWAPFA